MRSRSGLAAGAMLAAILLASAGIAEESPPAPASYATTDPSTPSELKSPDIVVEGEIAKKQRKVCMSETSTGSIMSRRACYTVAQLEERKRISDYVKNELRKKQDSDNYTKMARDNR